MTTARRPPRRPTCWRCGADHPFHLRSCQSLGRDPVFMDQDGGRYWPPVAQAAAGRPRRRWLIPAAVVAAVPAPSPW